MTLPSYSRHSSENGPSPFHTRLVLQRGMGNSHQIENPSGRLDSRFRGNDAGGRYEVRLSGAGGQGLLLAGLLLAEAAGVYEGREVAQTQSYGPESRGGSCRSDVIISDQPVLYPEAAEFDLLLAMTQEACDRYAGALKPEGILVIDPALVTRTPEKVKRVYEVPATQIAEGLGRKIVGNVVALGAIAALTGLVSQEALESAVLARAPVGTEELNRRALAAGFEIGKQALLES